MENTWQREPVADPPWWDESRRVRWNDPVAACYRGRRAGVARRVLRRRRRLRPQVAGRAAAPSCHCDAGLLEFARHRHRRP